MPFPQWPVRIVVLSGAIGGLWWLRNLNVYGSVQPAGLTPAQADTVWPPLPAGSKVHVATYAHHVLDRMTTDVWGALGLTVPPSLPGWITFVASVLAAALMLLGFVATFAGRRPGVEDAGRHVGAAATGARRRTAHVAAADGAGRRARCCSTAGRITPAPGNSSASRAAISTRASSGWSRSRPSAPTWSSACSRRRSNDYLPVVACVLAIAIEVTAGCVVLSKLWLRKGSTLTGNLTRVAHAVGANSPWPGIVTIAMLAFVTLSALAALAAVSVADRDTTDTSNESLVPAGSAP